MIFSYDGKNLELDRGWQATNGKFHKKMENDEIEINTTQQYLKTNTESIPYYHKGNCLASFPFPGFKQIPYDHDVEIINGNLEIKYNQKKTLNFTKTKESTLDEMIDVCIDRMSSIFDPRQKYLLPKSNGVDCTAVQSVMDYFNIDYDLFVIKRFSRNEWYKKLQKLHWGFMQTPYSTKKCNVVTGMYGDEYLLRNPKYVQYRLLDDEIDLSKEFEKNQNGYMWKFYKKFYEFKVKNTIPYKDYLQIILNDWQMWHVNQTTIINPFFNKDILFTGLSLDADNIIKQVTDAYITKQIIKRMNPKLLSQVDETKNLNDPKHFNLSVYIVD